ncbi:hypothetical protein RB213_010995 [Colletotrichum asianum]
MMCTSPQRVSSLIQPARENQEALDALARRADEQKPVSVSSQGCIVQYGEKQALACDFEIAEGCGDVSISRVILGQRAAAWRDVKYPNH